MATRLSIEWLMAHSEFPLVYSRAQVKESVEQHSHDFMELAVVTGGEGCHIINGVSSAISCGDVMMLNPGDIHSYEVDDGTLEISNVWFVPRELTVSWQHLTDLFTPDEVIGEVLLRSSPFSTHLSISTILKMRLILAKLETELLVRTPGYRAEATALLTNLLVMVLRGRHNDLHLVPVEMAKLKDVIRVIEHSYADDISLENLARVGCLTPNRLICSFKEVIGETPMQYLTRVRIDRAKLLLIEGRMSITQVALMVGFNDSNYFSRCFKRVVGVGPRSYLQQAALME